MIGAKTAEFALLEHAREILFKGLVVDQKGAPYDFGLTFVINTH